VVLVIKKLIEVNFHDKLDVAWFDPSGLQTLMNQRYVVYANLYHAF